MRGVQELSVQLLLSDVQIVDVAKNLVQGFSVNVRDVEDLKAILVNLIIKIKYVLVK